MEITDVRVKLINVESDRLKAVCTVTFDKSFVVRDVKVVEGTNGLFVAMPSRKLSLSCQACGTKNHLRARFCNDCGKKIPARQEEHVDTEGRGKLHRDIAHPITASFRAEIQEAVIQAFEDVAGTVEVPEYDYAEEEVYDEEEEQQPRAVHDEPAPAERPRNAYGDMIAGLRGSRAPSGPSPKERETPRDGRRREERPAPKQERTDRGPRRGGNGRGRGGRRNERREECPSESVAVREPEVESAPKVKERKPEVKEEPREPSVIFGEDKPVSPTFSKREEKVEKPPATHEAEAFDDEEDDGAPFGAGL